MTRSDSGPAFVPATPTTAQLKAALGRFSTGVTVITCVDASGAWVGLTVSSFSALSLQPPLVLWSLRHASASLGAFLASARFAVNVLAADQTGVSHRFAVPGEQRFAEGGWVLGLHGAPLLPNATAVFECETVSHQVAGDHELFIGRVLACTHSDRAPLLYSSSHYHRLGSRLRLGSNGEPPVDDELLGPTPVFPDLKAAPIHDQPVPTPAPPGS
jgi:flavin reductase (DIM6/NTAB) family NADH-FMN oxidoreductase RutF